MLKQTLLIVLIAFTFQTYISAPSPLLRFDFCQGACETVLKTVACGFCTTVDSGLCTAGDYVLCVAGCLNISICKKKCEDAIVKPCVSKLVDDCYNGCVNNFIQPCTSGCDANAHSICEKGFSMVANQAISKGCGVACTEYLVDCDIAGGGPEDPVGDAICLITTAGCAVACEKIIGAVSNPQQFTDMICSALGM